MPGKKVATFQQRFIELIDSSAKSQTAIAHEFGVAKQTISAWYNGQSSPRIPVVASLSDYFGVSLDWLNGFDVPKYCGKNREMKKMDTEAILLVEEYVEDHLDKSDPEVEFETYIVWKCKALQNWKYLISTSLPDGMYYEMTYNGDKNEWYLDAYKKFENMRIEAGRI